MGAMSIIVSAVIKKQVFTPKVCVVHSWCSLYHSLCIIATYMYRISSSSHSQICEI